VAAPKYLSLLARSWMTAAIDWRRASLAVTKRILACQPSLKARVWNVSRSSAKTLPAGAHKKVPYRSSLAIVEVDFLTSRRVALPVSYSRNAERRA
jgi:hypothetical protein